MPCHLILRLVHQHTLSKVLRAQCPLSSYSQRNCEPIALTQMKIEGLRKVCLGDTDLDEMEEGIKIYLQKEKVESLFWYWQNVSVIDENYLGYYQASCLSHL